MELLLGEGKSKMTVLPRWPVGEDGGQDLVEWALLLGLIAIGVTTVMFQSSGSVSGVWNTTNLALLGQAPSSDGSSSTGSGGSASSTTNPAPPTHHRGGGGGGWGHGGGDHHHHY